MSYPTEAPIGVMSAIAEEFVHLDEAAGEAERIGGLVFTRGAIADRPAVFVEAGVGKVNAALVATLLLTRFGCRALMFCGVAGGVDPALGVGDVVVGVRNVQHDFGALVRGRLLAYQPGVPPLPGFDRTPGYDVEPGLAARLRGAVAELSLPLIDAAVIRAAARIPHARVGTIVSGDAFVNCEDTRRRLHAEFGAHAVEMEGGAIAQICARLGGMPFANVRCLSDLAGAESHLDFRTFLPVAGALAAVVARRVATIL